MQPFEKSSSFIFQLYVDGISKQSRTKHDKNSLIRPKSVDFSRYTSSTWKGLSGQCPDSMKSSKSVTFTSTNNADTAADITGMLIEAPAHPKEKVNIRSISTRPWKTTATGPPRCPGDSLDDTDLWLAFLVETGLLPAASAEYQASDTEQGVHEGKIDDPGLILKELEYYQKEINQTTNTGTIRDEYENMHRSNPGLFWDTVEMDDPKQAFLKMKNIIKDIVMRQPTLTPMFNIDFANMTNCHIIEKKVARIRNKIAPQRLFRLFY